MSNFLWFAYVEFLVLDVLGCCSPGVIYDDVSLIFCEFFGLVVSPEDGSR
jgi:hypothetical protein